MVEGLSDALAFSRTIGMDASVSCEKGGGRGRCVKLIFYQVRVLLFLYFCGLLWVGVLRMGVWV
jgi:hypothetical protein